MNYLCRAGAYLNSATSTANSMCDVITGNEFKDSIETQYKIAVILIKLEQDTSKFILDMELDAELPKIVAVSRRNFISINEHLIKHLEKIQFQGYNTEQLITTLKLENETLKEEIRLS